MSVLRRCDVSDPPMFVPRRWSRDACSGDQARARRDEERVLFIRFARDRDRATRDALVELHLPLARRLASGFSGSDDIDDLEQVAAIGLVKAIDRFEPERGMAFSTLAVPTILGELKRHLRDRGWSVHVPRRVKELSIRVTRVSTQLSGELGRSPTVSELAARADSTSELVVGALNAAAGRRASSLDQPYARDDRDAGGREIAVEDPGFSTVEDSAMLDELLQVLKPRERLIVELRFREDRLQSQIAEHVGMSQMHVSRVIKHSLEQLRSAAADPETLQKSA
jgi:RNA polymerase sigma-B factor